jgi:hypothetical protein
MQRECASAISLNSCCSSSVGWRVELLRYFSQALDARSNSSGEMPLSPPILASRLPSGLGSGAGERQRCSYVKAKGA